MNCLSENIEVVYIPLVGAFVILPGFEFAAEARLKDWVFKVYAYACARCLEFSFIFTSISSRVSGVKILSENK